MSSRYSPTVTLCQELIRRPSVTPDDAGCQALLGKRLSALGFKLEPMRFGDVDNLWARSSDATPVLVFAGHTDVVPTGDQTLWHHPPFGADVHDEQLYGRGAADMKSGVAAMITATEAYLSRYQPRGAIAFLLTSDEEGPAINGTTRVVEALKARNEVYDWCIVGEPTSSNDLGDIIKNGRRGSLNGKLQIHGRQGHVAYPHQVINPVHQALQALDDLVRTEWDKGNEHFPATSFQISNVQAGTGATNVTPATLTVDFNWRFSSELCADDIKTRVIRCLDSHDFDYTIDWRLSGNPFITEPGTLTDATQAAIRSVCGREARLDTGGGTSDGRFIATSGAQVIELGPCNKTIHQVDEHVSINELDQLHAVYLDILKRLFGVDPIN